jgi:hypothetical protein
MVRPNSRDESALKKILKKIFFSFHQVRGGVGSEREKLASGRLT